MKLPVMAASRWLGTLAALAVLAVLAVVICVVSFYHSYPGIAAGLIDHAREATWNESMNLSHCLTYWVGHMEKLRLDEATGVYDFGEPVPGEAEGFEVCIMAFHRGRFGEAARCAVQDIERHGESEDKLFWLAMSYMRQAEARNCLDHLLASSQRSAHQPDHRQAPAASNPFRSEAPWQLYCTLPIGQFHDQAEISRRAARVFEKLLTSYDTGNEDLYRWLLSFSYMTVDGFPDEVPAAHRIDTDFIDYFYGERRREREARYAYLDFTERAAELGVDTHDTGRGVAVEDFDGDGFLDIVTGGAFDVLRYYRNIAGTTFEERTEEGGLAGVTQPFAITAADYDNDGWIDLFVARPFDRYILFRNDRDGTFTDATGPSGLLAAKQPDEVAASWNSAWADIDNDGDLDLFLAQWGMKLPFVQGILDRPRMDSKLFVNQDGRFVDRTADYGLAGLLHDAYFVGATFGDYDNDGYPDLFVSSPVRLATRLLHNRDGAAFEPVDLVDRTESGFFASFLDVNHDGRMDIFQGGFGDARTATEMSVFGKGRDRYKSGHSTILLQNEQGRFEDRYDFFEGDMPMATMGVSFGDLNNDGCFDFYLGTGNPESWFVLPHLMFIAQTDGRRCSGQMENISMLEGFGTVQKGHGIVFFDFDDDGDQDIYSSLGGMWPVDRWPNQLFVNQSRLESSWVKIRLRGRRTNHFGLGARITVTAAAADGSEIVRRRQMDNKTGFGSSPYLAHVGLLDAERVERVEVFWPVSRCTQRYDVVINRLNILDEDACAARPQQISEAKDSVNTGDVPEGA